VRLGSAMAYVKKPSAFSLSNYPSSFYLGMGGKDLFRAPVRPAFRNQLLPTLYSETWGDWGCYFLVYGIDPRTRHFLRGGTLEGVLSRKPEVLRSNYKEMVRTLGRVNAVALFPSTLLVLGLVGALPSLKALLQGDRACSKPALLLLTVLATFAAYLTLLILFPSRSGNMLKATYVLPAFPALGLLAADLLMRLREASAVAFRLTVGVLAAVALHNSVAFVTRYTPATLAQWGL